MLAGKHYHPWMKPTFEEQIRNPEVIWYGPHECPKCGRIIVKSAMEQGGLSLDAADFNHRYPNFKWEKHKCSGNALSSSGGKARAKAVPPARRKAIAQKAAKKRWSGFLDDV